MRSLKSALTLPTFRRKRLLIVIGAVTVLLIVVGVIGSVRYWNGYERTSLTSYTDYKKQLDQALATNADEMLKKLGDLHASVPPDAICDQPAILGWQTAVIEDLNKKVSQCRDRVDRLNRMDESVTQTIRFFTDTKKLTALIAGATSVADLDDTKLKETAQKWAELPAQIKDANVGSSLDATTIELESKVAAVSTAWTELQQAHEAKDRAKYEAAAAKLMASYDAISGLVGGVEKLTNEQVMRIETTYSEVMN